MYNALYYYHQLYMENYAKKPLCNNGKGICIDGKCTELPIEGEEYQMGFCSYGLICDSKRICRLPTSTGGNCDSDLDCADTLFCANNICTAVDNNHFYQSCSHDSECLYNAKCTISEKRICKVAKAEGEQCIYAECAKGLYCDDTSKICKKLPLAGNECTPSLTVISIF